ncbi:hypothetical protein RFI_27523, partial [Reticulomyxa filosa]
MLSATLPKDKVNANTNNASKKKKESLDYVVRSDQRDDWRLNEIWTKINIDECLEQQMFHDRSNHGGEYLCFSIESIKRKRITACSAETQIKRICQPCDFFFLELDQLECYLHILAIRQPSVSSSSSYTFSSDVPVFVVTQMPEESIHWVELRQLIGSNIEASAKIKIEMELQSLLKKYCVVLTKQQKIWTCNTFHNCIKFVIFDMFKESTSHYNK